MRFRALHPPVQGGFKLTECLAPGGSSTLTLSGAMAASFGTPQVLIIAGSTAVYSTEFGSPGLGHCVLRHREGAHRLSAAISLQCCSLS